MTTAQKEKRSIFGDIFDRVEKLVDKEVITLPVEKKEGKQVFGDIFDRVEKLIEKDPTLKKYTPPERVELSNAIAEHIRSEIARNMPKQRIVERVVEKESQVDKKAESVASTAVHKIMQRFNEIQEKKEQESMELRILKEDHKKLKEELQWFKDNPREEIRVLQVPLPNMANKNGQILTTNGREAQWGLQSTDGSDFSFYLGDQTVDGCWRITISGNALQFQRKESGNWVEKGGYLP